MQELAGIGELVQPWHSNQINLLTEHIRLISEYSSSLKVMDNHGQGRRHCIDDIEDDDNIVIFLQAQLLSRSQLGKQTRLLNFIPQICIFSDCGRKMPL